MPLDELTTVALPCWGSDEEPVYPTLEVIAADGNYQAFSFSDTYPTIQSLRFILTNAKFDALRAFIDAHANPPMPFTMTHPRTGQTWTLRVPAGVRIRWAYRKPNYNDVTVPVISVPA